MKNNNLPITTFDSENFRKRKDTYDVEEAISAVSEAACNFAKALKISCQTLIIESHVRLQENIKKCAVDDNQLRRILGDKYDKYK